MGDPINQGGGCLKVVAFLLLCLSGGLVLGTMIFVVGAKLIGSM